MEKSTLIMDEIAVTRALARITHEIIEHNNGVDNVILLGIKTRGVPLAKELANNILKFEGKTIPVGILDITMHRDDLSAEDKSCLSNKSIMPDNITGKTLIIVDDVLYTGRTIRAAIESIFSQGRPKEVQLAVLIDRGHRELPVRPDYIGKNVPTSHSEKVHVHIKAIDNESAVYILHEE